MPEKPYLIQFDSCGSLSEGYITSTQFAAKVPFVIRRVFWTYHTPQEVTRGRHAHKETQQVLVALRGQIKVELDNGKGSKEIYQLNDPATGLFLPAMHWANLYFSEGSILLCMASTDFDESDYIREFDSFLTTVKQN